MWCLFIRGSQDVEFCWTHPTLPLSCFYALLLPQAHVSLVIPSRFHVEFMYIDWYLRGCESVRKLLKLWLVVVEGGMATRIVCCAESQNTGSPPLLQNTGSPPLMSDLYCVYACWMEHEGHKDKERGVSVEGWCCFILTWFFALQTPGVRGFVRPGNTPGSTSQKLFKNFK